MSGRLTGPLAYAATIVTAAMLVFILAPLVVTVAISVGTSQFAAFPPRGFTLDWYAKVIADPDFQAGRLSTAFMERFQTEQQKEQQQKKASLAQAV